MRWLSKLRRRARLIVDRETVEREMRDEMRFHLEMEAEELTRFGTERSDALRLARRRFGGVARYEDEARDARGGGWLEQLRQDTRYALRVLGRGRGFVAVAVLTLALGVGANTAIFSVVRGVLLRALPYPEPQRLVAVQSVINGSPTAVSPPDFLDWRAQAKSFSELAAYFLSTTNLTGGTGEPERLTQARVSANFFDILGVRPERGRGFVSGEDAADAPRVAILSDGLWRRRFGADPKIVGGTIRLDDVPTTVIGIAPPEVKLPAGVDLWLTTRFEPRDVAAGARGARWIEVVGRLSTGATLAGARAEMNAIAQRLALVDPHHDGGVTSRVATLQDDLVGGVRTPLLILLGAVGFVMLIACVNVASLSLGRTAAREMELTVRVALGAGRGRIARQILTESLVLAVGGGVAGLALAVLGTRALVALAPGDLPLVHAVHVDGVVLSFSLAMTLLSGVAFGVVPAVQGSRQGIEARLRAGSRGLSLGAGRLRRMLVITEVALAMILLSGAGLLVRSLARLSAVDPGFRPDHLGTFSVTLSPARYPDAARQGQFARELEARLARLPGVTSAGISFSLPLTNSAFGFTFTIGGRNDVSGPDEPRAQVRVATPDYFRTMGIPLLRGRAFTTGDDEAAPHVILISQETARRYWPNEDPIGQTLQTGWGRDPAHHFGGTIIGIVGDVRQFSLAMAPRPEIYGPLAQRPLDELSVVIRSSGATPTVLAAARDVVRGLDSELPVYDARSYDDIVRESVAERRFYVTLLATFAGLALVLAAIGIYGVIAYSVQQRRRELGIRIALGASHQRVIGLVMRQGMTLTIMGTMIGLAVAGLLTRVLRGQLYDVSATDPLTFAVAPVMLLLIALVACVVPARRAIAVDPATTIRAES